MGAVRVYIRPIDPAQTTAGVNDNEFIDVSEDVASGGIKIKDYSWVNETTLGDQRISNCSVKLYSDGDKYSQNGSVFNGSRDYSLVRITWITGKGLRLSPGFFKCGPGASIGKEITLYEGIINDSKTKQKIGDKFITFNVLGKMSALENIQILDVPARVWNSNDFLQAMKVHYVQNVTNNSFYSQLNLPNFMANEDSFFLDRDQVGNPLSRIQTYAKRVYDLSNNSIFTGYNFLPLMQDTIPGFTTTYANIESYEDMGGKLFGQIVTLANMRGHYVFNDIDTLQIRAHSVGARQLMLGMGPLAITGSTVDSYDPHADADISNALILIGEGYHSGPENIMEIKDLSINKTKAYGSARMNFNGKDFVFANRGITSSGFDDSIIDNVFDLNTNGITLSEEIPLLSNLIEYGNALVMFLYEYCCPTIELKVKTYLTEESAMLNIGSQVVIKGLFFSGIDRGLSDIIFNPLDLTGSDDLNPRSYRVLGREIDTKDESIVLFLRENTRTHIFTPIP